MRGRNGKPDSERIVNFAEFTGQQKYKDALLDLAARTGRTMHEHFRAALKEYTKKHNVEFFVHLADEEIARKQSEKVEMQAQIRARNEENRQHAEAIVRRVLSDQMSLGVKVGGNYKEQLAGQLSTRFQLPGEEMLELVDAIFIEFAERYKDNYRGIRHLYID
jgi:hypothetical protein